jgi:hypothetical protein
MVSTSRVKARIALAHIDNIRVSKFSKNIGIWHLLYIGDSIVSLLADYSTLARYFSMASIHPTNTHDAC